MKDKQKINFPCRFGKGSGTMFNIGISVNDFKRVLNDPDRAYRLAILHSRKPNIVASNRG